jgi:hypothetical protein
MLKTQQDIEALVVGALKEGRAALTFAQETRINLLYDRTKSFLLVCTPLYPEKPGTSRGLPWHEAADVIAMLVGSCVRATQIDGVYRFEGGKFEETANPAPEKLAYVYVWKPKETP